MLSEGDNERLCAIELRLWLEKNPPSAGLEPGVARSAAYPYPTVLPGLLKWRLGFTMQYYIQKMQLLFKLKKMGEGVHKLQLAA